VGLPKPCCWRVRCVLDGELEIRSVELGDVGEDGGWRGYGEAAGIGKFRYMDIKPLPTVSVPCSLQEFMLYWLSNLT